MAVDEWLRPIKDNLLQHLLPILPFLSTFQPISITYFGLFVGIINCFTLYFLPLYRWINLSLWMLNRLFDGLDGYIARKFDKQTDFGGYMDLLCDFVIYCFFIIALVQGQEKLLVPNSSFLQGNLICQFVLSSYMINGVSWMILSAIITKREVGKKRMTTVAMPPAIIEGTETIAVYTLLILLLPNYEAIKWVMLLFGCLVFVFNALGGQNRT